jgi:hypothetical protein
LTRAAEALERGRGADAAQLLTPALRSSTLTRDDELAIRCMSAEAALLSDDLDGAVTSLGARRTRSAKPSARPCSRRCGGCTAASPSPAPINRERSRTTSAP